MLVIINMYRTNWSTIEKRLQRFKDLENKESTRMINERPKKEAENSKRQLAQL
jgi:small subunit ribosomal protein S2